MKQSITPNYQYSPNVKKVIEQNSRYLTPNKLSVNFTADASKQIFDVFSHTWWTSEIAVKFISSDTSSPEKRITWVEKIAQWWSDSVEVDLEQTKTWDTALVWHNHLDSWALAFSKADIDTNSKLQSSINQEWHHLLQKNYIYNGTQISSFVVSRLNNTDNQTWSSFTIDNTDFTHAFMVDGKLLDINDPEMPADLAIMVLEERLWVVGKEIDISGTDAYDMNMNIAA